MDAPRARRAAGARWAALALLLAVLLQACGGGSAPDDDEEAVLAVRGNPAAGEAVFARSCAVCHGADLQGTAVGPPLLHEVDEPSHHPDAAFVRAVREGVQPHHWGFGPMPPVDGLDDDELADVIASVRARQREAGIS